MAETRRILEVAKGSRNPNWKGGVQDSWSELKNSTEYKIWRKAVFERDNYICRGCGYSKGKILHPHHILRKVDFPHLIFAINNGITLCRYCHEKIHSKRANYIIERIAGNSYRKDGDNPQPSLERGRFNDYALDSKEKKWSELHSNMQSEAEMTSPLN